MDDGLGTIGGGNHFVEVQWIEEVNNTSLAYQWGVKKNQLAFMIHSGSRHVSKYIGRMWRDRAQSFWQKGAKYTLNPVYFPFLQRLALVD